MLLFVKKRFADDLQNGRKTIELRVGARFRNVKAGDSLSINGSFRLTVTNVQRVETLNDLLTLDAATISGLGFDSSDEFLDALIFCYPNCDGPFFLWSVVPSSTIKNPPSEQYSIAF